ncbi:protein roadkill-like [Musca vetustissima]|uniref:protein roadkill-like n=1 Tax=Musca vetustissima TaxID=27455 RepID=UPI002AB7BF45|nr:protein roadkill-like [Musca vetustissima]
MNFYLDADGLFVREHRVISAVAVKIKNQTAMKFYSDTDNLCVREQSKKQTQCEPKKQIKCEPEKRTKCKPKIQIKCKSKKKRLTGVLKYFANIFASKEFSDVTLVTEDKTQFQAHKVVLCARSEVFAAMLRKQTGSITINDMDSNVLKELLNYIYTEEEIPKEMAANLFVAANKYALLDLQKMCEDFLIEAMSVDTVADILLLGDRHSSERLKSKAVQFAIKNIKSVTMTECWKRLREIELELCMDVLEKAIQERW